ncbi:hypothetical protein HU200_039573 [Digitaria exilis]|uniref:Rx N-terminal domain-containing protein n=1 Tax=Digitaria exilis TaxID=1010633 RepID=A0A835EI85_9POAL|nr:hypothetical protein HU200_039573 [Digitaria exilis]CAB3473027.1 unnamed protein product [Digitaria exilis]
MTELAAGAVSSLLLVIRNETVLLRGVQGDVQFIKEEMESMNSFLAHLARSVPPGGEHNEQVRTWMNQVRLLAQDCNSCIDLYLYRGNPDIHRAKGRLRRHLWWVYWFLRKMIAQHRAAVQLRQLKDRARDVGERRLRYGVEVPGKSAAGQSPSAAAGSCAAADEEEEYQDEDQAVKIQLVVPITHYYGRRSFFEPRTLDDYVKAKLLEWVYEIKLDAVETLSIAIVTPDADKHVLALAHETLVVPYLPPTYERNGYGCGILVNIPAMHHDFLPLGPEEVLYYILRVLKHGKNQSQGIYHGEWEEKNLDSWQNFKKKLGIHYKKEMELQKIRRSIEKMKIYEKLNKIKSDIKDKVKSDIEALAAHQQKDDQQLLLGLKKGVEDIDLSVLLKLLIQSGATGTSQLDQVKNNDMHKLLAWDDGNILKIAKKLKDHMNAEEKTMELNGEQIGAKEETAKQTGEAGEAEEKKEREEEIEEGKAEQDCTGENDDDNGPIRLRKVQYAQIIQEVFLNTSRREPLQAQQQDSSVTKQATKTMMATLDEERIKQMTHEIKLEVLRELQESKQDKNQAIRKPGIPDQNQLAEIFEEVEHKIEEIKQGLEEQMRIKGIVDKIIYHLEGKCPLVILKVDRMMDVSRWEEIRKALSLLKCSADAVIFTTTESIQEAKGYCYQTREPIDYSLVGLYYDTVLELTSKQKNEDNYNPQVFRDILEECEPHEFCMKIFTHALYANPKRSNVELTKFYGTLKASEKSFDIMAKKMFMYSYNDLPKEYKSCLLYLAIFTKGQKIRRSTLIERWVVEGLTLEEDWASSMRQAHRCFGMLIHRWLVYPADISANGKVKSCLVGDLVHGFITTIARKQHFVETRLSHHLARHFSIFNDLKLRSSDRIDKFFEGLSKSSQVSPLKVLDLKGCRCFGGKNQRYLKDICTKMLLLKYLSLRGTYITQLPREINYLRELEVLDIRQTKVAPSATANILLLKLKRLLAGDIDMSSSDFGSVQIPHRIDKMDNIEVLSNVKAPRSNDLKHLKHIGKLWQLRKLGVVINNKDTHLKILLHTISDLHECLRSLSITLSVATPHEGTSSVELPPYNVFHLEHHPKILESLSISGTTLMSLLPVITKGDNDKLAKVTLSRTLLNEDGMDILAKLPKLQCVRLRHITFTEHMLNFKKGEFRCLKYLLVEDSDLTNITFEDGAAHELEKIVLSSTSTMSVSGAGKLPKLEELELNISDSGGRLLSSFDNAKQIAKLTLRGAFPKQDALKVLAKKPNLRCLVLMDVSFDGTHNEITLGKDEFIWLNLLVVDCSSTAKIVFTNGSAPRLEKITWSSATSLSGIDNLPRLKELEFKGISVPKELKETIKKHQNKPSLKYGAET